MFMLILSGRFGRRKNLLNGKRSPKKSFLYWPNEIGYIAFKEKKIVYIAKDNRHQPVQ